MKLTTKASILHNALTTVGRVVERRNTIPVLSCVLIGNGKVRATDLDMEIEIDLPTTSGEGSICIDHATMARIVRHVPGDDTVTIEGSGSSTTLSFSLGRYDLPSLPASDYPEMAAAKMAPVKIDGDALKKALAFVTPFISTEETRYYLNGVCLDGNLAVATDGHRLGCHPTGGEVEGRPILPRKAVALLSRLPAAASTHLATDRPMARFDLPGARLTTKLIDGTFPDWRRVIPTNLDGASKLTINRAALLSALRRAMAVAPTSQPCGTLSWGHGRLALAVKQHGSAREYISHASVEGAGYAAFNVRYLIDLLTAFRASEEVLATVVDPGSPAKISAEGEAFAVIMPMRSGDEQFAIDTLHQWVSTAEIGRAA